MLVEQGVKRQPNLSSIITKPVQNWENFPQISPKIDGKSWREEARGKEMQRFNIQLRADGVIRFEVPGQDVAFLGRYELKNGRLKVCYPGPLEVGKPPQPPAKIEPGPKVTVAEWERAD
jgi:hypothetical protein